MSLRRRVEKAVLPKVRAVGGFAWTAGMLAAVDLNERLASEERREEVFEAYMRRWSQGLLRLTGTRIVMGPMPTGKSRGPRLIVANHRTAFDIPVLLAHFGGSVLSRGDLAEWPIIGPAAKKAQTIFVDQDSRRSKIQAMRAIRQHLQAGRTVSVFPEGTTYDGDQVRPFFRGAFAAAKGLDVDIVPVGLAYPQGIEYTEYSFLEHVENYASRPRVMVGMWVGEAERATKNADEMATHFRARVQALVERAREAVEREAAGG